MIVPFLLGCCAGVGGVLVLAGGGSPRPGGRQVPGCAVSIVCWAPSDTIGREVDAATGGLGFSHVTIDGCEVDDSGATVLLECQVGHGVRRVSASEFDGRPYGKAILRGAEAAAVYGYARGRIGTPYGADGAMCASFVYDALTPSLQARVDLQARYRWNGTVSPNQIAAGLGIATGHEVVI